MGGTPDFAHAAFPETLDQTVAPEFLRACGFLAEGIHDALPGVRQRHDQDVGKDDREEEFCRTEMKRRSSTEDHPADDERHRRHRRDRCDQCLRRTGRDDDCEERRPDGDP